MQTIQVLKIGDNERKEKLFEILADPYCRAILKSTMNVAKSAMDITFECKIPISTAYRRIQTLVDHKLLDPSGIITDDGKRLFLYKSKIRGMTSSFSAGNLEIELIYNS